MSIVNVAAAAVVCIVFGYLNGSKILQMRVYCKQANFEYLI